MRITINLYYQRLKFQKNELDIIVNLEQIILSISISLSLRQSSTFLIIC